MRFHAWLPLALLIACSAHDPKSSEAPTRDDAAATAPECAPPGSAALITSADAETFAKASGPDFASCGRELANERTRCCDATTAGYGCLLAALESCSPARFAVVTGTVEGDAIFSEYFVRELDGACRLFVMTDRGQDAYRDPSAASVETRQCERASLRVAAAGECPSLDLDDCEP